MELRVMCRAPFAVLLACVLATGLSAQGAAPAQASAATVSVELLGRVFKGLSAQEISSLRSGQPLVRQNAKPRVLSLALEGASAQRIRERFAKLGPNYFAEFLLVLPAREGFLEGLDKLLSDPRGFIGLPYYSVRNDFTYQLFDKVEILGRTTGPEGETTIRVLQHMEPFDDYAAAYSLRRGKGEFFFSFENEGPLVYTYRNFKAAGPGDQVWMLSAFEREGLLWFYGAGGVRAFDLFGAFRSRLEASFMGRIESFFGFVMKSLGH